MDDVTIDVDLRPRYPELEVPEFRSLIPTHLISSLNAKEQYLVETLSKLEQKADWLIRETVNGRKVQIEVDLRLQQLEERRVKSIEVWRQRFSGTWLTLSGGALILITAVATTLIERWFGK